MVMIMMMINTPHLGPALGLTKMTCLPPMTDRQPLVREQWKEADQQRQPSHPSGFHWTDSFSATVFLKTSYPYPNFPLLLSPSAILFRANFHHA